MNDFFDFDPHLNGAKGLVMINDMLLVYRRDANAKSYPLYLDLPGGGKEKDETPFETFRREVEEEFGLSIAKENIIYAKRYPSTIVEGEYAYFPVASLPDEAESKIKFGDEGLEYTLMNSSDFMNAPDVWPGLQTKAKDYFDSLDK
jgi:8-oxo-dGTP diphosphatase